MGRRLSYRSVRLWSATVALLGGALVGCDLFFPCTNTHRCGDATIDLKPLDPSVAGAVEVTIRRKDLPSEQVTCRWQATTAVDDAGATVDGWSCDPAPTGGSSSSPEYDAILVQETDYELVLTGPTGTTTLAIEQERVIPGDACGCVVGTFHIPDSVWAQVGAL